MLLLAACASALGFTPAHVALAPALGPAQAPLTPAVALRALRVPLMAAPAVEEAPTSELPSFVQTEMRGAAMALHTRDQAPREGKQPAQRPVQTWQPGRPEYLQFLVDSRHVYLKLEEIVNRTPEFATFRAA